MKVTGVKAHRRDTIRSRFLARCAKRLPSWRKKNQTRETSMQPAYKSSPSTWLQQFAQVRQDEVITVAKAFLYFFLLMASYFILRPIRDAMGTVYGVSHLQDLFTGTFIVSFIAAPLYAGLASRIRLTVFLPWVYGFIALTLIGFFVLFSRLPNDRLGAAAFFVWTSTFNLLTISVFWSMMADIFSSAQSERLFGLIAAGGTLGTIAAPAFTALSVKAVGVETLLLISAAGFAITGFLVRSLERENHKIIAGEGDDQLRPATHKLGGTAFDGFILLARSKYLMSIAVFVLLMTTISTVIYFQLADLISKEFASRAARTQAYAVIDLATNSIAIIVQFLGTSRFIRRFGVTGGLLLNPVIMVAAFLAIALSPVLIVLGSIQVGRRFAEYAIAKPSREMLFTVVEPESKYKAKNVIDTVVYRFGDLTSAWLSAAVLPFGIVGLAVAGLVASAIWFPVAWFVGKDYERATEKVPARKSQPSLASA